MTDVPLRPGGPVLRNTLEVRRDSAQGAAGASGALARRPQSQPAYGSVAPARAS